MTTIAVLGANGRIARIAEDMLLAHDDIELTLFIHTEDELGADIKDNPRVTVVKGDAKNPDDVLNAINGADEVYANLAATQDSSADIIPMAKAVVDMMDKAGIKRLVWISSLGIYNEVPGEFGAWNANILGDYLVNYRKAVDVIEASDLDYTIIRRGSPTRTRWTSRSPRRESSSAAPRSRASPWRAKWWSCCSTRIRKYALRSASTSPAPMATSRSGTVPPPPSIFRSDRRLLNSGFLHGVRLCAVPRFAWRNGVSCCIID